MSKTWREVKTDFCGFEREYQHWIQVVRRYRLFWFLWAMRSSNETANFLDQFCPQESSIAIQVMRMLFCAIVILIALIGNAHIITVVCQHRRLRRAAMNLLVVNMSMADIIITVFNSPRLISSSLLGTDWAIRGEFGYILCKAFPFTKELSSFVLMLTLLLMAVDRLFVVLFPLKRFITNRVAYVAIFFVWIVAIALRSPIFNGQRFILGEDGQTYCFLQFDSWAGVLFLREVCICDLLLNPFDLYSHPFRRCDGFTQETKISWRELIVRGELAKWWACCSQSCLF